MPSVTHVLVGFGFGPIQAGLFIEEAFASGNFERLVVVETDPVLIDAMRGIRDSYRLNIETRNEK